MKKCTTCNQCFRIKDQLTCNKTVPPTNIPIFLEGSLDLVEGCWEAIPVDLKEEKS